MKFGITIFPTDYSMAVPEVARVAEERGFESFFVPEHTHIPASRKTPFPRSGELPREYWSMLDPFVGLGAAAMVTKTIKLGTGICLVIQRDPIVLAKEVATLDLMSGGRVLFGIGAGWNVEEAANHGTDFKTRWKLLRERIEAMKQIWTQENAEYHGDLVNFDPIWSHPKPLQKPHPPILLGGHTSASLRRVVNYCDGWMPGGYRTRDFLAHVAELRHLLEEKGRDPMSIPISVFWAMPDPKTLDVYRENRIERVVFRVPTAGKDEVMPQMDEFTRLAGL